MKQFKDLKQLETIKKRRDLREISQGSTKVRVMIGNTR
jgi:hypothetical protein